MNKTLALILLSLSIGNVFANPPEEIVPLEIQGDVASQVATLNKQDRIRFGKYIATSACKLCHNRHSEGKTFFEDDQYLRDALLSYPSKRLAIIMRSKMRHKKMPPDEMPKLEKYQWRPVYEYVRYIEKQARGQLKVK